MTRSAVAAIPARYASTRLPGKPLIQIGGMVLIERVFRQVARARSIRETIVLTDDDRIAETVRAFGGRCEMTPTDLPSGTDRIAYAAGAWNDQVVLNVQGDEPLIEPAALDRLAEHLLEHPEEPVATLAAPAGPEDAGDPNVVKVVADSAGRALYFSRAPIPFPRHAEHATFHRHIGVYGYQKEALLAAARLPRSPLERAESLEQLRLLESGVPITVLPVPNAWPGVDTIHDVGKVERLLAERGDPLAPSAAGADEGAS